MKRSRLVLAWCLVSFTLWAKGVSGKWTAEVPSGGGNYMGIVINEEDGLITGSVRDPDGEIAISNGTQDGDNISFSVIKDVDGYQVVQRYRGTVEDDLIHFQLQ